MTVEFIRLEIPLRAIPKGRPRFYNRKAVTPPRTKQFEQAIGWFAKQQYKGDPINGDCRVDITLVYSRQLRGDTDNYAKSILDGMNGIVFTDDKQIAALSIEKLPGEKDQILVTISTSAALKESGKQ